MPINILLFGQLTGITGKERISLDGISNTVELVNALNREFPALAHAKYVIAVNKQVITGNRDLQEDSTIALLPPFSGG